MIHFEFFITKKDYLLFRINSINHIPNKKEILILKHFNTEKDKHQTVKKLKKKIIIFKPHMLRIEISLMIFLFISVVHIRELKKRDINDNIFFSPLIS